MLAVCLVATAAAQPDMLIYFSDDHSQADASLYGNGNIPTPHMEALAADGMKFTHAFVASPSCAPSRAALLTGVMPARNGAEGNHQLPNLAMTPSLIANLKAAGYEVVAFGKIAHQGSAANYGFDHVNTGSEGALEQNVLNWLGARTSTAPLCLFVGTSDPHVGWSSPSSFDTAAVEIPPVHLDTPSTRAHRARYYEEIKEADALLGSLRQMAADHMREDLLFIHSSDHGAQWAFGKWTLYDYGIRVPLVAAWPGHITPGATSDAMVSWVDIIPTLIDIAGGTTPAGLDGYSFRPVLEGAATTHRDRIFTTHTSDLTRNAYPSRSVRTGEWKLIRNFRTDLAFTSHTDLNRVQWAGAYWGEWAQLAKFDTRAKSILDRYHIRPEFELYHLVSDPWEQENVAGDPANQTVLQQLTAELQAWMTAQADGVNLVVQEHPIHRPETWHPDYTDNLIVNGGFAANDPLANPFVQAVPTGWTNFANDPADNGATQDFIELFVGANADSSHVHPFGGQGNSCADVNDRFLQQTVAGLAAGKRHQLEFTLLNTAADPAQSRGGVGEVLASDGAVLAAGASTGLAGQQHQVHRLEFTAPADGTVTVRFRTTATTDAVSGIQVDNVLLLAAIPPLGSTAEDPADLFTDNFNRFNHLDHGGELAGMGGSRLSSMIAGEVYWDSWEAVGSTEVKDFGLLMANGTGMTETAIRHNFVGPDILAAGGFSVQMSIESINSGTSDAANRFVGFGVGLSQAEAQTSNDTGGAGPPYSFRGTQANPVGTADFFIDLAIDGNLRCWRNGAIQATIPVGKTSGYLTVGFSFGSFEAGAPVVVQAFLDGALVDLDPATAGTTRTFTWDATDTNHIGLSSRCTNFGRIDHLAIRKLPLSASLASAATVMAGLEGTASGLSEDPDQDGDDNFTEWLKAGSPTTSDAGVKLLSLSPSPDGDFRFNYVRLNQGDEAGLTYTFSYSTHLAGDPSSWPTFLPEVISSQAHGPSHELRLVRVPVDLVETHDRLFIRMRVD